MKRQPIDGKIFEKSYICKGLTSKIGKECINTITRKHTVQFKCAQRTQINIFLKIT
jgi:hypothetical protein